MKPAKITAIGVNTTPGNISSQRVFITTQNFDPSRYRIILRINGKFYDQLKNYFMQDVILAPEKSDKNNPLTLFLPNLSQHVEIYAQLYDYKEDKIVHTKRQGFVKNLLTWKKEGILDKVGDAYFNLFWNNSRRVAKVEGPFDKDGKLQTEVKPGERYYFTALPNQKLHNVELLSVKWSYRYDDGEIIRFKNHNETTKNGYNVMDCTFHNEPKKIKVYAHFFDPSEKVMVEFANFGKTQVAEQEDKQIEQKSAEATEKPKENEEHKIGKCFCNRDITEDELKQIVKNIRDNTYYYDKKAKKDFNITHYHGDNIFYKNANVPKKDRNYTKFAQVLSLAFRKYGINKCSHKIHFLANMYVETMYYTTTKELGDDLWYDPYRGRGFQHLTKEPNYKEYQKETGIDIVTQSNKSYEKVADDLDLAADTGAWYWKRMKINEFAEKDSLFDTARLINHPTAKTKKGINGYKDREIAWVELKKIFDFPKNCSSLNDINTKPEDNETQEKQEKIPLDGIEDIVLKNGFIQNPAIIIEHISVIEHGNFKNSIKKIILHRTAGSTTDDCKTAFKNGRKNKKGGVDHYGTHFIVGKDGKIYQTADLTKITWHCAGWNSKAIGIEVVGAAIDKNGKPTLGLKGQLPVVGWEKVTDEQAKSVAVLVKSLLKYYKLNIENIDCHEYLAPKEKGEGQIVYDAIKPYLK